MTARGVKAEEVVAFVAGYIAERGYSPSIRDICDGVGLKSKATVWYYLERLRDEGRVTWLDHTPRTLRVVPTAPEAVPTPTPAVPTAAPVLPRENPLAINRNEAGDLRTWVRPTPQDEDRAGAANAPRSAASTYETGADMRTIPTPPEGVQR